MKMKKMLLPAAVLLAAGRVALAEDAGTNGGGGAGGYYDELPVVLSASRLVQTVGEAPAAVTVIDREMIRSSGVRDVVDLLRLVPGMVVGMYKAHRPTLGFNGLADPYFRQLQVLLDGVSLYSPFWGGAEWNQLPVALEDIERVEVVRGPNAATFGANSFLGVVNIITRDPATERGAEVGANIGEKGIRDLSARFAASQGDLRYRVTLSQRSDEGLDSKPDTRRTNFLGLRGHYRLSGQDELRVQAGYVGGSQGDGVYSAPNHTDGPRIDHYDSGNLQLRWTRTTGMDEEVWLQFSCAERNHRDWLPYRLLGRWDYPLSLSYRDRRADLELQQTMRLDESLRGVWGAQVRADGAQSPTYFSSTDWRRSSLYRLFGNLEWRPSPLWIVSGGVMAERNSLTGSSLSPSLALNRQLSPGHALRFRWASAHRTPTLFEDKVNQRYAAPATMAPLLVGLGYGTLVGLPLAQSRMTRGELEDERIRSSELSYLGQFPALRLNVELSLFRYRMESLMGWEKYPFATILGQLPQALGGHPDYGYTYGYVNSDSARVSGQSATIQWRPWQGATIHIAASRTGIRDDGPQAALVTASGPVHAVGTLLSQEFPADWQVGVGYYRVGAMQVMSGGDPLPATDRVDLRVAKRFRIGTARAEAALVVHNAAGDIPVFERKDIDRRTSWLNVRLQY